MEKFIIWTLFFLLVALPATGAPKTDVVVFSNGDRLTGEIKSFERGQLRFNTDATNTISIEWDYIAYIRSDQNIQVETDQGLRLLGHLSSSSDEYVIAIDTGEEVVELKAANVVLMTPIEEQGVNRLDGDITAGYNFAKASSVEQVHFGLDVDYRTETRIISLQADATTSDSEGSETSQRENLGIQYRRLWPNRWLVTGMASLERNDELEIDLRTSLGAGGGRILRQTNSTHLALEGGLRVSRENVAGGLENEDTLEASGELRWDWFRYDSPELDVKTKLEIIPNLTNFGRVRGEFDISLKWELIDDLFWELSFYDSYDSDPVVQGAEKNDYGVNTSLGWDF